MEAGAAGRVARGCVRVHGCASERQGIKPSHGLLEAARGCDDSVTIWWKTGVGQGREGGGVEQKKNQCLQMGWRVGWSLLICCLRSVLKITGKQRPRCLSPATSMWPRGRSIWDMEMCIKPCNSACLHDADRAAVKRRRRKAFQKCTAIC